jgi:hypothetical protein
MKLISTQQLERLAAAATPGPWQWWTSNSTLRLTGADGKDGGVLHAYAHRGYGDISCNDFNRAFIAAANPLTVLAMIRRIDAAEVLLRAAKVYAFNYLQDEAEDEEDCVCGPKQHAAAKALFESIARYEAYAVATRAEVQK